MAAYTFVAPSLQTALEQEPCHDVCHDIRVRLVEIFLDEHVVVQVGLHVSPAVLRHQVL
jgi:hypothetical protein